MPRDTQSGWKIARLTKVRNVRVEVLFSPLPCAKRKDALAVMKNVAGYGQIRTLPRMDYSLETIWRERGRVRQQLSAGASRE